MTDSNPPTAPLTVHRWRATADMAADATPLCPGCGRHLGIRLGIWRGNCRDAWLCDKCGEMESV